MNKFNMNGFGMPKSGVEGLAAMRVAVNGLRCVRC